MAAVGGLISIQINPEAESKKYKISVEIPVCKNHLESDLLEPLYIDYDRYKITRQAHDKFIEKWRQPKATRVTPPDKNAQPKVK